MSEESKAKLFIELYNTEEALLDWFRNMMNKLIDIAKQCKSELAEKLKDLKNRALEWLKSFVERLRTSFKDPKPVLLATMCLILTYLVTRFLFTTAIKHNTLWYKIRDLLDRVFSKTKETVKEGANRLYYMLRVAWRTLLALIDKVRVFFKNSIWYIRLESEVVKSLAVAVAAAFLLWTTAKGVKFAGSLF